MAIVGMLVLLGVAWAMSRARGAIRWRTVGLAFALQLGIGVLVFRVPWGRAGLEWISERVAAVIAAGQEGITFLFGSLATGEGVGFVFAFRVLPVIVFFSSLIAVLYHLRIMQGVIAVLGGGLRKWLGTSRAESLSAAANIFVGQTEAPLVVKPYIERMTRSELFAVMCGGLASVAGSVLAGYAGLGAELKHLLAASFMAAPGGLLFAKLLMPETESPDEVMLDWSEERPANVFDAAAAGASDGMRLALNVGAMLLAFIGLIALVNLILGGVGGWFGQEGWSLEAFLGWLFSPVAWLVGIPWKEASQGGALIGQKLVLNEFVAYVQFHDWKEALSGRTRAILTVALCGFANLSSIAILLGGLGGIAPTRRAEIARFGLLAVMAGTFSNLMSAAIAGLCWVG
ncbi:CNT family concentrative nucleoside transporter [Haloferula luteola]|uniref:Nucleoside permease n=1 Tax=Haloferula luteola TaxID=595692 RepID=A0A840VAH7_9BACT|nr:NupC/NupG family nucleoside CNT transporter [Haloferula luteola]MBB5352554.1 CNT family concentrative nucleoside transporter [Haloferula luteola]